MMSITRCLLSSLLLAFQVYAYALPEPHVAIATSKPIPNAILHARSPGITARAVPSNAANPGAGDSDGGAIPASESAALASFLADSDTSDSDAYAAYASEIHPHLDASQSAHLAAIQSDWTRTVGASAAANTGFDGQVQAVPNSASVDRGPAPSAPGNEVAAQPASSWVPPSKAPYDDNSKSYGTGAYEVTCLDSSKYQLKNHNIDHDACGDIERAICNSLNDPSTLVLDQWAWADKGQGCAMGYWLPKVGPAGTAPIPPKDHNFCDYDLFDGAYRDCIPTTGGGGRWNAVSLNVAKLPVWNDAGQQHDPGKISILIAGSPYPCGLQDCHYIDTS